MQTVQLRINDAAPRPVTPGVAATPQPSASLVSPNTCGKGKVRAWAAGALTVGYDHQSDDSSIDFHTDGVTEGADAHLSKNVLVGAAVGQSLEGSAIGNHGTSLRASSTNGAIYGSYRPSANLYFDGLLGRNNTSFQINRWNEYDSSFIPEHRTAHSTFASVLAGFEYQHGRLEYSPYLRADSWWSDYGAMSDYSNKTWGLSYAPMRASSLTWVGGVRAAYQVHTPLGLLSPRARLELRNTVNGQQTQNLLYTNGFGPSYTMTLPAASQGAMAGSFGFRFNPSDRVGLMLDYDFMTMRGGFEHTLQPYINLSL